LLLPCVRAARGVWRAAHHHSDDVTRRDATRRDVGIRHPPWSASCVCAPVAAVVAVVAVVEVVAVVVWWCGGARWSGGVRAHTHAASFLAVFKH
jgi:hypothetical protein